MAITNKSKEIIKELPLNGKLITADDPTTIGNNFQALTNLRYGDKVPKGIKGMTKVNSGAAISTYIHIQNGFHFRKEQPAESHVLVHAADTNNANDRVLQNTTAIPSTGNFSGTALWTDTSGGGIGRFSDAPGGQVAYANGVDTCIWGGDEMRIARFVNVDDATATTVAATTFWDFTNEVTDTRTDSLHTAVLNEGTEGTPLTTFYIGSTRPLDGVKFTIGVANTATNTMAVRYWSGSSWEALSDISDGTHDGTGTLAQSGSNIITWTSATGSMAVGIKYGLNLFWLKFQTVTAACSATTSLTYVTADAPFQQVRNVWDGTYRVIFDCQVWQDDGVRDVFKDYTRNVFDDSYDSGNTYTYADISDLATDEYIVVGFAERMMGLKIGLIGDKTNTTAATTSTNWRWTGSAWSTNGGSGDGTSEGSISFAKSGFIVWTGAGGSTDRKRTIGDGEPLYYYKITFNQALSPNVYLYYVAGIPASDAGRNKMGEYKFTLMAKNRLWLCSEQAKDKNSAICSMKNAPDVYNGEDSIKLYFGDESELTAATSLYSRLGSSIYNITLFFKANSMYGVTGNSPLDFVQYPISETIGCVAPLTLKTVTLHAQGENRQVAIWQGANGVYMFDNNAIVRIDNDISDIMDGTGGFTIYESKIASSIAFVDEERQEYHWLFSATATPTLNHERVFDLKRLKWFRIGRGSGNSLQCGFEVADTDGNTYTYGGLDTGYMERLENGTDSDGTAITHTLQLGDIAPNEGSIMFKTQLIRHMLVMKAKSNTTSTVAITHYGDTDTSTSLTVADPTPAGSERVLYKIDNLNTGDYIFHSLKYVIATNNETIGFEPIFIGLKFNVIGELLA